MKRSKKNQKRRINAKLYPIYKMFSWDLLFFYSIEFLFYTFTKKLTATEILVIDGLYITFRVMMYIPAVAISDIFGKRKSIIMGNILQIFYILCLLFLPGAISVILANLIFALGYNMKQISESNLLYDSVSTKGGEGLYSRIDAKGGSWYYILDGIASLMAGYLFVVNPYLPVYICLGFILISTILSFFFQEIYAPEKKTEKKSVLKEYGKDLKVSMKFITKSRRMKAYILFGAIFYGIITIFDTYKSDLLTEIGISEEQFSMIFAILTFIGGMSINLLKVLEKKFKNRIITFLSLTYILSYTLVGVMVTQFTGMGVIPIILLFYCLARICTSIWYILEYKYLKNFSEPEMRNKITFTYEFIGGITASLMSVLGGLLLKVVDVKNAVLLVGLASMAMIVLVLDYMRTRFGLKPEEYRKEDIEFVEKENDT